MTRSIIFAGALALTGGLLAGATMVDAHHAMVMYDSSKTLVLEGAVVDLRWSNPHVFVRVEGRIDDGPAMVWVLETFAPGRTAHPDGRGRSLRGKPPADYPKRHCQAA